MANEFLGKGFGFPLRLDSNLKFKLREKEDKIKESILIILGTTPGERAMRPEFGCGINDYLFSVINIANLTRIEEEVKRALALFEPRIRVENVKAAADSQSQSTIMISIDYIVKSTNDRQNMVYPFYLNEKR